MKTLYVSDLDGTLLRSSGIISDYTCRIINGLTDRGVNFSYATARSYITAKQVTRGLVAKIPLVVYNGSFIVDNATGETILTNSFDHSVEKVFQELFRRGIYPVVYSVIDGIERFAFIEDKCSQGVLDFADTRRDRRRTPVKSTEELTEGECFYITCIDEPEKLFPLYEEFRNSFNCVYQRDFYTGEQWLEIMPKWTSKANAVMKLKELLNCDRVVAFGDGKNDIDMFKMADECYAVANAVEELKNMATDVIAANDEDGVARWLERNCLAGPALI